VFSSDPDDRMPLLNSASVGASFRVFFTTEPVGQAQEP
jgi:hypothetical protein